MTSCSPGYSQGDSGQARRAAECNPLHFLVANASAVAGTPMRGFSLTAEIVLQVISDIGHCHSCCEVLQNGRGGGVSTKLEMGVSWCWDAWHAGVGVIPQPPLPLAHPAFWLCWHM